MISTGRAWGRAAGVTALVLVADRLTKAWVESAIGRGDHHDLLFGIELVNVRNRGIAFGLFAEGRVLVLLFTAVALLGLLAYFATHSGRRGLWLPTGLLLGGALGNLIDRVRDDAVTDFVDLPLWPAFNLADTAITVGVVMLLYVVELRRDARERVDRDRGERGQRDEEPRSAAAQRDEDPPPEEGERAGVERAQRDGDPRPA